MTMQAADSERMPGATAGDGEQRPPRVAVLGGGPGGYPAAFLAAEYGMDVTLINNEPNPGGVCLYRGCIPSKALLHLSSLVHEAEGARAWGIEFGEPRIDLAGVRGWKNSVVEKLTRGLGALAKQRRVRYLHGLGRFSSAHSLQVDLAEGGQETVEFDYAIVATGSHPAVIPALRSDSPRVMDSTAALELPDVPDSLLVIGGGYIGLELGSVYAALGSRVTVVEATGGLLPGADRDLVEVLEKQLRGEFADILLETRVTHLDADADEVRVTLAGTAIGMVERTFSRALIAVGRRPSSAGVGLRDLGIDLDERGFIVTDEQRRTRQPHIFAVGDVAGEPMLAHKATYEARVAVEAIAGEPTAYDPAAIPAVVFTDPQIGWTGLTEADAARNGIEVTVTRFPWAASGRATTIGRNDGFTKLLIDPRTERILGVAVVGPDAGELIAEATLAIELGATATDFARTVHQHPTLSETVMEAAELLYNRSPHYIARRPRAGSR